MDSALSDPHNGSTEASSPANGTTRPPSTPEGIALAYGSLLLMALLPIFFGALRSVRCARGKVGSRREPTPSAPIPGHGPHEPVPAHPITGPLSRVTHPPGGHRSPFPPLAPTSVAGLRCPTIWPLLKAGISIVLRGPQTDPATSPPPDPLLRATAGNTVRPTSDTKAGADSSEPADPSQTAPHLTLWLTSSQVFAPHQSDRSFGGLGEPQCVPTGMALKGPIFCHPSARSRAWPHPQLIVASRFIPKP